MRDVGSIWRSLANHGFFEAQLLGVDEVSDRPIIDLEAALGEFGDKPAQGEVPCLGALLRSSNQARYSPEIALGLCPPICPGATLPVSRRRRTQTIAVPKLRRCLMAGHAPDLNRCNHPTAKIH